jgi:hypothetical protein
LDENAVDLGIVVQLTDELEEIFRRALRGEPMQLAFDAGLFAGFALVSDIYLAGGVFADQDGRQARNHSFGGNELGNTLRRLCADFLGQNLPVKNRCRHEIAPEMRFWG